MMADPRVSRMADVLVRHSLGLQPGDLVVINGSTLAYDLIRETYRAALGAGAHPIVQAQPSGLTEILLNEGSDEQLETISPVEEMLNQRADAELRIIAEENTRALSSAPSDRLNLYTAARKDLRLNRMKRAAQGDLRWSLTLFPTHAHAQDAQMSLDEYREFVFEACYLNDADPVSRWQELSRRQAKMIDWLKPRRDVHVLAPDTDLRLSIEGRAWNNSDGKRNFPSGEVFTGPIEDSAEGHIRFTFPANIQGHEVSGIRLKFEAGKVVDATAERNEDFFLRMLDTDDGARRIGEFAFGTNDGIQRFTGNTLYDEKIGGTIHLALGAGYPDTGSTNVSAIHQDMVCDIRNAGEVWVDGETFLTNGRYLTG
jgi:aminopeptidase